MKVEVEFHNNWRETVGFGSFHVHFFALILVREAHSIFGLILHFLNFQLNFSFTPKAVIARRVAGELMQERMDSAVADDLDYTHGVLQAFAESEAKRWGWKDKP